MNTWQRFLFAFIPLALFILLSVFLLKGLNHDPKRIESVLINHPAPAFKAPTLLSDEVVNQSIFKGHITLLNVWATWCVTCRVEHPFLMTLAKDKRIRLVGLDYKDEAGAAIDWLKHYGDPYQQVVLDTEGNIAIDFGVYGTPESFLIDQRGVIRYKFIGALNEQKYREQLLPVIEQLISEAQHA